MLSKSAARAFFLAGTAVTGVAFIGLTIDSIQKVPEQTRASELSESAIRGKVLWEDNNCMGCHTLFGEGAYYAPELTKVYDRRGPAFIDAMLIDPESMYPGRRKMQKYDFTEQERKDLIAFLKWCGNVDLNGFPPEPELGGANTVVEDKQPQTFKQLCAACHTVQGSGGKVGPALDGIGARLDADYLEKWLRNPQAVKPGTTMPKLPLTDVQIKDLVTYLGTLKEQPNTAAETSQ